MEGQMMPGIVEFRRFRKQDQCEETGEVFENHTQLTKQLIDFVKRAGAEAEWQTSVCTGALILHECGILSGKKATTHWGAIDALRQLPDVQVIDDERYVRDGNVITSAGVSAGIDMALYLVSFLKDPQTAQNVQKMMEYYPKPPTFEKVPA